MDELERALEAFRCGRAGLDETVAAVRASFLHSDGAVTIDHDRERRTGYAEVVFAGHKSPEQLHAAFAALAERGGNVLATRVSRAAAEFVMARIAAARYEAVSRLLSLVQRAPEPAPGTVAVVTAGTSDLAVAEEAAQTAGFYGSPVTRIDDVGVAGVHRLLARLDALRRARVIVVVAGMEGALPTAVAGLVAAPVIAVPTSVGYGAAFGGLAALLAMLNSCAPGVSVVNIDNGFGAGQLADRINRL